MTAIKATLAFAQQLVERGLPGKNMISLLNLKYFKQELLTYCSCKKLYFDAQ